MQDSVFDNNPQRWSFWNWWRLLQYWERGELLKYSHCQAVCVSHVFFCVQVILFCVIPMQKELYKLVVAANERLIVSQRDARKNLGTTDEDPNTAIEWIFSYMYILYTQSNYIMFFIVQHSWTSLILAYNILQANTWTSNSWGQLTLPLSMEKTKLRLAGWSRTTMSTYIAHCGRPP